MEKMYNASEIRFAFVAYANMMAEWQSRITTLCENFIALANEKLDSPEFDESAKDGIRAAVTHVEKLCANMDDDYEDIYTTRMVIRKFTRELPVEDTEE